MIIARFGLRVRGPPFTAVRWHLRCGQVFVEVVRVRSVEARKVREPPKRFPARRPDDKKKEAPK